ncbi:hypothetical protein SAMN05192534_12414 [Alteribacillus persepolensis]|uniref:Uncharacterized protein n=1 Tax=Alteribacillus persepolensis TaxID=568899 RepID=A0A1G8IGY8_9BACI|nr:hypothetical protein [Alteribacillus persepolensis]SDI18057.1 hypothetical protein SAMN05192534_12414 [Alteribacillus persepolensis]
MAVDQALKRELLLLINDVSDDLLSFDGEEMAHIYLPELHTKDVLFHLINLADDGLLATHPNNKTRLYGLTPKGRQYVSNGYKPS